jgi:hypothetical protein
LFDILQTETKELAPGAKARQLASAVKISDVPFAALPAFGNVTGTHDGRAVHVSPFLPV